MMSIARLMPVLCALCACMPANSQDFEWNEDDSKKLSDVVASGKYGQISSLWIEKDGELFFESYFHGTDADTRHNMRSVGKTITGMLVGTAIDDGFIRDVDVRAVTFFDDLRPFENADPRKEDITLRDLLTMSGPLECDDWNSYSRGNEERMYLVEDWSAFFWNLPIKNRPSWEVPDDDGGFGRLFSYCTAGAQLLGEIVERAVGESAPDYAGRRLFAPAGIENPKWNHASTGKTHLGGGLELTTEGWACAARLYANGGRNSDVQVVPKSWIDASFSDYVQIDKNTNYGYLWWRPGYEVDGVSYRANVMNGSGGNRIYVLPEFDVVVVMTKSDFRDRDAHAKSDQFFADEIVVRLKRD